MSSTTKIVSHDFWRTQMVEMLPKMIDPPSHDACIIVGTTQIPVDKTVLRLNSSLLLDGIVDQNTSSGVTQIEVEPEFDDQPQLVGDIINSFYSGTIAIEERDLKVMYKFGKCYKIEWLIKIIRPKLTDFITKSVDGSYERFKEIFTFAHFIYDTDLLESCMAVLDEENLLQLLIEDKDMLSKISYICMELITKSELIGFSENELFTLLASWAECREQQLSGLKDLFGNINYEKLGVNFIVENVMEVMSKDKDLSIYLMVTIQQVLRSGMKRQSAGTNESSGTEEKRICRMDDLSISRFVTNVIDLVNNKKDWEIDMVYLNNVLSGTDIQYISEDLIIRLMYQAITTKHFMDKLVVMSISNLLNNYNRVDAAKLFIAKIVTVRLKPSDFYKIEWTKIKPEVILYLLQLYNDNVDDFRVYISDTFSFSQVFGSVTSYIGIIEIALTWCLSNITTVSEEILTNIISEICYKTHCCDEGYYHREVLLPTIQHLLPNTTKLKCSHSGDCYGGYIVSYIRKVDLRSIYRLEPFSIGDIVLSDKSGLLELGYNNKNDKLHLLLYNRKYNGNNPLSPNYPIFFKRLDDEAIRNLVGSLEPGDIIGALHG